MTKQQMVTAVAKFPGHCEFCGKPIAKGDVIAYSAENQCWVHPACWEEDQIGDGEDGYDDWEGDDAE